MAMYTITKGFADAKSMKRADNYYLSESKSMSGSEDYYFQGATDIQMNWAWGFAKDRFGMDELAPGDLSQLSRGINPRTGEMFVDAERFKTLDDHFEGRADISEKKPIAFFSTLFAVSKSVSVFFASADEETRKQMLDAGRRAIEKTLDAMTSQYEIFGSRRRNQNGELESIGGTPTALCFAHCVTRPQGGVPDPHLHFHCEMPNSILCDDGTYRTLDAAEMYRFQKFSGALFSSMYANELRGIKSISKSVDLDFEKNGVVISGVSDDIQKQHSRRHEEINRVSSDVGMSSAGARAAFQRQTKEKKNRDLDVADLLANWKKELSGIKLDGAKFDGVDYLKIEDSIFCGTSIAKKADILAAAAKISVAASPDEIIKIRDDIICGMGLIEFGKNENYVSLELLQIERETLALASKLSQKNQLALSDSVYERALQQTISEKKFNPSPEQQAAAKMAITGGDIVHIEGRAGTGKSSGTLHTVATAYANNGFTVIGAAPSGKAAEGLSQEIGQECSTLHSILLRHENNTLNFANSVVILDEAGMADLRTTHKLISAIDRDGGKLILTGDTKQLESVGSAAIFRGLKKSIHDCSDINKIIRQKNPALLDAVNQIYNDDSKSKFIETMRNAGMYHDGQRENQLLMRTELRKRLEAAGITTVTDSALSDIKSIKAQLPNADRKKLSGVEAEITAIYKTYAIEAAKFDPRARMISDIDAKRQSSGSDFWAGKNNLVLADTNADVDFLNKSLRQQRVAAGEVTDSRAISVFSRSVNREIENEFGVGDRIIFKANSKSENLKNGDIGKIIGFNGNVMQVIDLNGKSKDIDFTKYRHIDHAYAMTVHKSQGVTYQNAHYLPSSNTNRLLALVAISRAVNEAHVYAHSKQYCDSKDVKTFSQLTEEFNYKKLASEVLGEEAIRNIVGVDCGQSPISNVNKFSIQQLIEKNCGKNIFGRDYLDGSRKIHDESIQAVRSGQVVKSDEKRTFEINKSVLIARAMRSRNPLIAQCAAASAWRIERDIRRHAAAMAQTQQNRGAAVSYADMRQDAESAHKSERPRDERAQQKQQQVQQKQQQGKSKGRGR